MRGFAVGIERALTHEPDLVWLLDDDTVPTSTAAAEPVSAWSSYRGPGGRTAVLASKVVWTDGRDHDEHPAPSPAPPAWSEAARAVGCVPIRSASFVSIMCDAEVVERGSFQVADYFLWNDDFEYSPRLIRPRGVGLRRASVVEHKTKVFGSTDADPGSGSSTRSATRSGCSRAAAADAGGEGERRLHRTSAGRTFALGRPDDCAGRWAGARRPGCTTPRHNADVLLAAGEGPTDLLEPGRPFSLLLSTYAGDDPGFLREAFESTVVSRPGPQPRWCSSRTTPVPDELAATIADLANEPRPGGCW